MKHINVLECYNTKTLDSIKVAAKIGLEPGRKLTYDQIIFVNPDLFKNLKDCKFDEIYNILLNLEEVTNDKKNT